MFLKPQLLSIAFFSLHSSSNRITEFHRDCGLLSISHQISILKASFIQSLHNVSNYLLNPCDGMNKTGTALAFCEIYNLAWETGQ